MTTAFVLGGGGLLGAHEVGMLRALADAGVRPDLVVGTSIGALNGVMVAADPAAAAERLSRMWRGGGVRPAVPGEGVGPAGPPGGPGADPPPPRPPAPRSGAGAPRAPVF